MYDIGRRYSGKNVYYRDKPMRFIGTCTIRHSRHSSFTRAISFHIKSVNKEVVLRKLVKLANLEYTVESMRIDYSS